MIPRPRKTYRRRISNRAFLAPAIVAAVLFGAAVSGIPARAEGPTFRDFPLVIFCNDKGVQHAYYFSRLDSEGVAIYITPDKLAGTITADGVAEPVGGKAEGGDCLGKSIDELRASGQAFDLPG